MTDWLGVEHARDVLTHHQAGHAGVAAEEVVGHGDHAYVVAAERVDERLEHPRTERTREDADRCIRPRPQRDVAGARTSPGDSWGPVAVRGRAVDPGEEAVAAGAALGRTGELELERARHADAV